jgi:hypothetical protein
VSWPYGLLGASLTFLVACSTSTTSSGSPNKTPGQCVLSNGIWYCGTGYGNIPQCPGWGPSTQPGSPCDYDAGDSDAGGLCFDCYFGNAAGLGCTCRPGDSGGNLWQCLPTETGCHVP